MTFNVRNFNAFTQLLFIWLTQSNISTFISQVNIPTVLGNCAKKNMIGQRAAYPYLQFRPLLALVIITAANEGVRRSSTKSNTIGIGRRRRGKKCLSSCTLSHLDQHQVHGYCCSCILQGKTVI